MCVCARVSSRMEHLHRPSHPGPKVQRGGSRRFVAWRSGPRWRDERSALEKVNDGSLLKGLASRSTELADRPFGMPGDSEEAVWVEYFRGVKTTWRICFTVKNFTLLRHLQRQSDWLEFRQALVTWTRVGLEKSLVLGQGDFRAPVSKIVVEAVRLLSGGQGEAATTATFAANVSLQSAGEPGTVEESMRKAMTSRGLQVDFAAGVAGLLQRLDSGARVSAKEVMVAQELPREIELRGGMREQLFIAAVPDCSRAANHGLCEGFELVAIVVGTSSSSSSTVQSVLEGQALQALRSDQVLKLPSVPVRLCFRSPFAKLPRFSSKQLGDRLGSSVANGRSDGGTVAHLMA